MSSGKTPAPDIWSHPDTPLVQHLLETMENTGKLLEQVSVPVIPIPEVGGRPALSVLARLIAALHDIGKSTPYFQKYIRGRRVKSKALRSHAKLGAVYAFWAVINSPTLKVWSGEERRLAAFIVSMIIRTHHGDITDMVTERKKLKTAIADLGKSNKDLHTQLHSTDPSAVDDILSTISAELNIDLPPWSGFHSLDTQGIDRLRREVRKLSTWNRNVKNDCSAGRTPPFSFSRTVTIHFLFSLLQESDKTNAMGRDIVLRHETNYLKILMDFYSKNFGDKTPSSLDTLHDARPMIFRESLLHAQAADVSSSGRIFTLEAPTGSGKTFSNLVWAFQMRERLREEKGVTGRIMYILPFTSIIEQTHSVLSSVLGERRVEMIKHHYLSKLEFGDQEDNELEANEKQFYIEGWNAEIVLSTFVQFFHSLFTSRKGLLRKYSKFTNSIIILDEVQAFPPRYWGIFNTFIPKFLEMTDSFLLLSTATLPGILEQPAPVVSGIGVRTFSLLDRTTLHFVDEELHPGELVGHLRSLGAFEDVGSFLFVANTVASSKEIFSSVREEFPDAEVFYLSASIVPRQRSVLIAEIREALERGEEMVILVSTQVIEAGVDLSFDAGYRDLAPLDSVIQSVGRVNRHSTSSNGDCWIIPLKHHERNQLLCYYIYDSILVDTTRELLLSSNDVPESGYRSLLKRYFSLLREKVNTSSSELVKAVCAGQFLEMNNFQLISDNSYKVPVFVELDEEAVEIWSKYKSIYDVDDWKVRRNLFAEIRPTMNSYIINVGLRDVTDLEDHGWIFRLPAECIHFAYDPHTGFVREKDRNQLDIL